MTSPKPMTLHYWLTVALKDLPEPVQLRLEDEYRAHLLDSESPNDVQGVLGDPNMVKKQLGSLYFTAYKLKELEQAKHGVTLFVYAMIAVMAALGVWIAWHSQGKDLSLLIGPAAVSLISAGVWRYSARLPLAKRQLLRSSWSVSSINVMLWCGWAIRSWTGEDISLPTLSIVVLLPFLWLLTFWDARQNYLRLDRTLRLVGTPS